MINIPCSIYVGIALIVEKAKVTKSELIIGFVAQWLDGAGLPLGALCMIQRRRKMTQKVIIEEKKCLL